MKRRLGISLYPNNSNLKDDIEYLEKAASFGFDRLFISMLELENETTLPKFKATIIEAKKRGFEVVLDVAPDIFKKLNVSVDDLAFFNELGCSGIRLDAGYNGAKEATVTFNPYNLIIELNMSNDVAYLDNILSYQANKPFIYGCHNFYPQRGTGLEYKFFTNCSKRFKKQGIRTAAFVSSQVAKGGPWDINDGLPTLEMHRDLPIHVQAKHLFATNLIDDVIIGNAYASDEELRSLSQVNRYQLELNVETESLNELESKIMFDEQHFNRGDINSNMIRSTEVRKKYISFDNYTHDNESVFTRGDIVIGNDRFGKYKNELQIILQDHSDNRKNKVGHVVEEELFLLNYIKPWTKFRLRRK
ncbi:MAG: DUF871 domain-containing protein [Bacteroidales bacterium]|nr:DUF871 domain-containing protein [Bacteroidales bacterium]